MRKNLNEPLVSVKIIYAGWGKRNGNLLHLFKPKLFDPVHERVLPPEKLDNSHIPQGLVDELDTRISEYHARFPQPEKLSRNHTLYR